MKRDEIESLERKVTDLQLLIRENVLGIDNSQYRKIENILNNSYLQVRLAIKTKM